ncbi:MAG: flagellin-like protein, partial [Rhodospirillales bacterium]
MAADITLSAAVRSTLLSLIGTTDLIARTQNRLSSGLAVASPIDDPVAFFQAKTLTDRAFDFVEKKEGIDQGIASLSAALDGAESIESLIRQLKGLATSLKSATGDQFSAIVGQYNNIRTQIGTLADDTQYQGVNLINSTSETLSISFSEQSASLLTVASVNLRQSGLLVEDANLIGEGGRTAW